ncbi:hypothetical protein [Maribacter spongiicola]|nr:hypothetical protein [Maribacter spongiicola]
MKVKDGFSISISGRNLDKLDLSSFSVEHSKIPNSERLDFKKVLLNQKKA